MAASNGIALLVVGRVIAGICVGISSAMVPVYQAEVAPKEIRGRVISLQQWAITWGILIQYFIVSLLLQSCTPIVAVTDTNPAIWSQQHRWRPG